MCNNSAAVYSLENKVVFVARGNCSFAEKAHTVQKYGAEALIVVSATGLVSVKNGLLGTTIEKMC